MIGVDAGCIKKGIVIFLWGNLQLDAAKENDGGIQNFTSDDLESEGRSLWTISLRLEWNAYDRLHAHTIALGIGHELFAS